MSRWTLYLAVLTLSGCAVRGPPPPPAEPSVPPAPVPSAPPVSSVPTPAPEPAPAAAPVAFDLWRELVEQRALPDCQYAAGIERWARLLTRDPERHAERLRVLGPFIEWVWGELKARAYPSEFALLPLVESEYRPVIAHRGGPGGWWQLMPGTARRFGLRVEPGRDERLDPVRSTQATIALLEHLRGHFGAHWLLVLTAYNVGEGRLARLIERQSLDPASVRVIEQLEVPRVTINHIHRLVAHGCILADPARYGVTLPPSPALDTLAVRRLPHATDLRAMASQLGELADAWRAQYRVDRQPVAAGGRELLLPDDPALDLPRARVATHPEAAAAVPGDGAVHVVRAGDSPWSIARRYRISLAELLQWNGLEAGSVLRIGQRLRLRAPNDEL